MRQGAVRCDMLGDKSGDKSLAVWYSAGVPMTEQDGANMQPKTDGVVKRLKQANMPDGLSKFWYACYTVNGKYIKVNTETEIEQEAKDQLAVLKAARDRGEVPVKKPKATYEDLRDLLISDYK